MQRKEKILQILESTDNQIIDFMNKASKYRENNLITYSKNIFIPLTEICKNDCGYCNFLWGRGRNKRCSHKISA